MGATVYKIDPFDATLGTTIHIGWDGAAQRANKIIISNADTGAQVYASDRFESYKGVHELPGSDVTGLVNGVTYKIKAQIIYVIGSTEAESDWSDEILFKCFATPVIGFKDVTDNRVFTGSNISLEVVYSQANDENLNTWEASLYSGTESAVGDRVDTSGTQYYARLQNWVFSGVTERRSGTGECYYLRITGTTVSGMAVASEYIKVYVKYESSTGFINLEATNNLSSGNITIKSNAVSILGIPDYEPVTYIYDNGEPYAVDLTNNRVVFDEGFMMNGDFTMYIKLNDMFYNDTFLRLANQDSSEVVEIRLVEDSNKFYLKAEIGGITIFSNYITGLNRNTVPKVLDGKWRLNGYTTLSGGNITLDRVSQDVGVVLRRVDDVYTLYLMNIAADPVLAANTEPPVTIGANQYFITTGHIGHSANFVEIDITNGIYDAMYITKTTTDTINPWDGTFPSDWDIYTTLLAQFSGNLLAGSIEGSVNDTSQIRLKRRIKGDTKWQTIYVHDIITRDDFAFEFVDWLNASNETYEYAYVPVVNGVEAGFSMCEVDSMFKDYFLFDPTASYHAIIGAEYSATYNQEASTQTTIGSKYPFIIKNGNVGYYSGNFTASFVEMKDCVWDWEGGVKYRRGFDKFLTNGNAKILKDWLGNIHMISVIDNIQRGDGDHWYTPTQEISWVECGDCFSVGDLYDNGFINTDYDREWGD